MLDCNNTGSATVYSRVVNEPVVTVVNDSNEVCVNKAWYQYSVKNHQVVIENDRGQAVWRFAASEHGWAEFAESQAS